MKNNLRKITMKALLMHVAADNSSKGTVGISGPIFQNNTCEFIPIRDGPNSSETRTYSKIKAKNQRFGKTLADFIPYDVKDKIVHYDPDFENFTYADPLNSRRGKMLEKLTFGDYVFFVASLAPFQKKSYYENDRKKISKSQKGKMAKFVIGYFQIQSILKVEKNKTKLKILNQIKPDKKSLNQLSHNAHMKRISDKFIVSIGQKDRKNALLSKAIPLTLKGAPFRPNKFAKKIYGDVSYPRGFKMITDDAKIRLLLKKAQENI